MLRTLGRKQNINDAMEPQETLNTSGVRNTYTFDTELRLINTDPLAFYTTFAVLAKARSPIPNMRYVLS